MLKRLAALLIAALLTVGFAPPLIEDAEAGHRSFFCGRYTRDLRPFAIHYFEGAYRWQGATYHVYRSVYPLSPWQNHTGTRRC